jgi:hypothetical protein
MLGLYKSGLVRSFTVSPGPKTGPVVQSGPCRLTGQDRPRTKTVVRSGPGLTVFVTLSCWELGVHTFAHLIH